MKKLLFILLIIGTGCGTFFPAEVAQGLKRPVVLVGKQKSLSGWCVVVRGGDGQTVTAGTGFYYSDAIGESYNIGDTLK